MMLAMVWMAVTMIPATASADMSGMAEMTHAHGAAGSALTGGVPWALAISIALGAAFAGATVWLATLLIREAVGAGRRIEVADLAASTVMAAGMSYVFLVLVT
jgi:hypothetical protein